MYEIVTSQHCAGGGYAMEMPYILWYWLAGVGFYTSDFSLLWFSMSLYPQMFLNYVLKVWWADPHPYACRPGLDTPSLECQLQISFFATLFVWFYVRGRVPGALQLVYCSVAVLFVPLVLFFSGNASLQSVLAGCGVGLGCGLATSTLLWFYITPNMHWFMRCRSVRLLGYKDCFHTPPTGKHV